MYGGRGLTDLSFDAQCFLTSGHSDAQRVSGRHLGFDLTVNTAIQSADTENPTIELNMKWIR